MSQWKLISFLCLCQQREREHRLGLDTQLNCRQKGRGELGHGGIGLSPGVSKWKSIGGFQWEVNQWELSTTLNYS